MLSDKKLEYVVKDFKQLVERLVQLFVNAWDLGMDLAKFAMQVLTIWEWFMQKHPIMIIVGKFFNKLKL